MGRPFKGLSHEKGPHSHYDVVLIGAGIGGLVCANLLQKNGLSVLLIERHTQVGGYCSTFRRKKYIFDAASHFYPLLGNPASLTGSLMQELDIQVDWVKMDPVDSFHFPDGSRFHVPADLTAYRTRLDQQFPEERKNLERFFKLVERAHNLGLLYYFRNVRARGMAELEHLSLQEVVQDHFKDRKLKLLLCADCAHWGSKPSDTSFVFDAMLRLSYFQGNYYPQGGSQLFADTLAARFEANGGHILMKSPALAIRLSGKGRHDVDLEIGPVHRRRRQTVTARAVIVNSDMRHALNHLVTHPAVPQSYLEKVNALTPTFPCYLLHIGLEGMERERLSQLQGYYWDQWDPELLGRNGLKFKIFVPTLYSPVMAPAGCQVMVLQKVLDQNYESIQDWPAHKAQIEGWLLHQLRLVCPGIDSRITVANLATAKTSFRFTGNYQGAMLGWSMSPMQLGEHRPGIRAPLRGLYFTGHWTQPGGGITPVIVSAQKTTQAILQDLGPET